MAYTKAEKEKIIRHFKAENEKRLESLKNILDKNAIICENKVLRRLNTVSVTLWNIKLKDVLEVERHHKPSIRNLLRDVESLRGSTPFRSYTDSSSVSSTNRANNETIRSSKLRSKSRSSNESNGKITKESLK